MKTGVLKTKSNFMKVFIMGICFTFILTVTAFAKTSDVQLLSAQNQKANTEDVLIQKQAEIHKYVFEEHAKDISEKGFKVTHTGPLNGYVQIGITPYNNENADYLYKIFGRDIVKIVEGQQAVLFNTEASITNTLEKNSDKPSSVPLPLIYTFAAVIFLSGVVVISRKLLNTK